MITYKQLLERIETDIDRHAGYLGEGKGGTITLALSKRHAVPGRPNSRVSTIIAGGVHVDARVKGSWLYAIALPNGDSKVIFLSPDKKFIEGESQTLNRDDALRLYSWYAARGNWFEPSRDDAFKEFGTRWRTFTSLSLGSIDTIKALDEGKA